MYIAIFALLSLLQSEPAPSASRDAQPRFTSAAQHSQREIYHFNIDFARGPERRPVALDIVNNIPMFRARIDGEDVWTVLDNHADDSLIDANFARQHGFEFGAPISPLRTPTGSVERRRVHDVPVEIPGQMRFIAPFSAVDLSFPTRAAGRSITLVLGKEYFENLALLIRANSLSFGPSGSLRASAKAPFVDLLNDGPQVQLQIGQARLVLTIDLGFNGELSLSQAAWSELGLLDRPLFTKRTANLDGRAYDSKHTKVSHVVIGPVVANDVDVSLDPMLPRDGDGRIGFGFLDRFDFALDVRAGKLWLMSPKDSGASTPAS